MTLAERDLKNIWHPYTQMKNASLPVNITKANGVYLFDDENNKYIDAISSWWVNIHGHCNKYIAKKVYEQFKKLDHIIFAGFTHEGAIVLAERLLSHLPKNQTKVFYSDNGSTAVEVAIKMAIQYWHNKNKTNKTNIIAFKNAYHGDTFGAMSVSGRSVFNSPFNDFLFKVNYIDLPYNSNKNNTLEQFKNIIKSNSVAAFIFEPLIQGAGGMNIYSKETLDELIYLCKKNNIITIADEVMTGFGRTGKYFSCDYLENKPDIFCLSKGITGGTMALSITSCTQDIYNAFCSDDNKKTLFHGHSYTANPIAISAALASLDILEKDETWKKIKNIEQNHINFIERIKSNKNIKTINSLGTILSIELESGSDTSYLNNLRNKITDYFIKEKILIRPLGNIIYLMPPYCINTKELKYIYSRIEKFIVGL